VNREKFKHIFIWLKYAATVRPNGGYTFCACYTYILRPPLYIGQDSRDRTARTRQPEQGS
jgi:hypothetical protein